MANIKGYTFQTNNSKFLVEFTNIDEWSMMKYCSPVKMYKAENNKVIFDNPNFCFQIDPWKPTEAIQEINFEKCFILRLVSQPEPNVWTYPAFVFNLEIEGYFIIAGVYLELISMGKKLQVIEKFNDKPSVFTNYDFDNIQWIPIEILNEK